MSGIQWRRRDDDDAPQPMPRQNRTPVKGEGELPKQNRTDNAADKIPPRGFLAGLVKAETANDDEQAAIEALVKKLSGKHPGKLSKRELKLAAKIEGNVPVAGKLIGKGGIASAQGIAAGKKKAGQKSRAETAKKVKKPWELFK